MTGVAFDHIHLKSRDPATSARFYREAFSAKEISQGQVSGRLRIVLEIAGLPFFIEEASPESAAGPSAPFIGLEHIGLRVDDLEAVAARLQALGVDFLVAPRQSRPGVRIAFIGGPDGERIELIERRNIES